jgi:hypothetical protein
MSTKFNAKRCPIQDTENRGLWFVDDLVHVEQIGPTLRLLFATVRSEHFGEDWRKVRTVVLELAIPAELREQIAHELLNFRPAPTAADGDNALPLH